MANNDDHGGPDPLKTGDTEKGRVTFVVAKSSTEVTLESIEHEKPPSSKIGDTFVTVGCAAGNKKKRMKAMITAQPETS